jgi:hypothetical protein
MVIGVRKKPIDERGPKFRAAIRQPQTTISQRGKVLADDADRSGADDMAILSRAGSMARNFRIAGIYAGSPLPEK